VRKRSKDHWREVLYTKPGTPSHVEQFLKFEIGNRVLRIIVYRKWHFEETKHSRPCHIPLKTLSNLLKKIVIWYGRREENRPARRYIHAAER